MGEDILGGRSEHFPAPLGALVTGGHDMLLSPPDNIHRDVQKLEDMSVFYLIASFEIRELLSA